MCVKIMLIEKSEEKPRKYVKIAKSTLRVALRLSQLYLT